MAGCEGAVFGTCFERVEEGGDRFESEGVKGKGGRCCSGEGKGEEDGE